MNLTKKEMTVLVILYQIKDSDKHLFSKDIALTKQYKRVMQKANGRNANYITSCSLTLRHLTKKDLISFIEELQPYGKTVRQYRINPIGIKEIEIKEAV